MKLKSPTDAVVSVALLSGHAISIGPEGRDVPEQFRKDAFIAGCLPCSGEKITSPAPAPTEKTREQLLVDGVRQYIAEKRDMTGAGLPNLKVLSSMVGFPVDAVALGEAMTAHAAAAK